MEDKEKIRAKSKLKIKYYCKCATNIWGKPNIKGLFCKKCNSEFITEKE